MKTLTLTQYFTLCSVSISFLLGCALSESPTAVREASSGAPGSGWKIKFDGSASNPVIVDDVLYVGSRDGAVYAFDANNGKLKWRFQTGEGLTSGPEIITVPRGAGIGEMIGAAQSREKRGKREVDATPVVESGTVYVGSKDYSLYAIDAVTGKNKWSFRTGGEIRYRALVNNGIVYVVSADGFLYAVDALTGQKRWAFETLQGMHATARRPPNEPIMANGIIFITNWPFYQMNAPRKSFVYAIDPLSGETKWTVSVDGGNIGSPAVSRGFVYFSSQPSETKLYAVDAMTGNLRWELQVEGGQPAARPPSIVKNVLFFATDKTVLAVDSDTGSRRWSFTGDEISTNIWVDDRALYVVTSKGSMMAPTDTLHALDLSTGKGRWAYSAGGIFGGARSVYIRAVHGGVIYVSRRSYLDAVDTGTGSQLWSFNMGTGLDSQPLIFGRRAFVASITETYVGKRPDQGYLYAIDARTGELGR